MTCSIFVKVLITISIGIVFWVRCSQGDPDSLGQPGTGYSPWTRTQEKSNDTKSELMKLFRINRYLYPRVLKNSTGVYGRTSDSNDRTTNVFGQNSIWERSYRVPQIPERLPEESSGNSIPYDGLWNNEKPLYDLTFSDAYMKSAIKTHQEHIYDRSGTGFQFNRTSERASSRSVVAAIMIFMGILSIIVRIARKSKQHSGAELLGTEVTPVSGSAQDRIRNTNDLRTCHILPCRRGSQHSNNGTPTDEDSMSDSSNEQEPISLASSYPASAVVHSNRARINGSTILIIQRDGQYTDPPPPYPGYPSNLPPTPSIADSDPPPYPGIIDV